jgi:hypothetical protein
MRPTFARMMSTAWFLITVMSSGAAVLRHNPIAATLTVADAIVMLSFTLWAIAGSRPTLPTESGHDER